jgi:hypothetical protein
MADGRDARGDREVAMTFLGLDMNATRLSAVSGPAGMFPCRIPLEPPGLDLPMVLSLEHSLPKVGSEGARLVRQRPHLTCRNFLADLGKPSPANRSWFAARKLTCEQALDMVLRRLEQVTSGLAGLVLALPDYLQRTQAELVLSRAREERLPLLGSVPAPLSAALVAFAEQPWFGPALVLDIDDHALTISTVQLVGGALNRLNTHVCPHLGRRAWDERLLDTLSDLCVRQSRRDPRDSPQADQALYEQIDPLMDACRQGRVIQIGLQAHRWYQNLLVTPDQPIIICRHLVEETMRQLAQILEGLCPDDRPSVFLLTAAAGKLPGLARAMRTFLDEWSPPEIHGLRPASPPLEDFGEGLIPDEAETDATVLVLAPDAVARGAHLLAGPFQRGELPFGHVEQGAPLPQPQPVEAGPARLHFQGEDYILNEPRFTLGRQVGCHLVFDPAIHRTVSPRHCEIIYDHQGFVLVDHSREGTLVNDRPLTNSAVLRAGDWIRLGPEGPLLRFLGGNPNFIPLTTTA